MPVTPSPRMPLSVVPSTWRLLRRSCWPANESPPLALGVTCGESSANRVKSRASTGRRTMVESETVIAGPVRPELMRGSVTALTVTSSSWSTVGTRVTSNVTRCPSERKTPLRSAGVNPMARTSNRYGPPTDMCSRKNRPLPPVTACQRSPVEVLVTSTVASVTATLSVPTMAPCTAAPVGPCPMSRPGPESTIARPTSAPTAGTKEVAGRRRPR